MVTHFSMEAVVVWLPKKMITVCFKKKKKMITVTHLLCDFFQKGDPFKAPPFSIFGSSSMIFLRFLHVATLGSHAFYFSTSLMHFKLVLLEYGIVL